MIQRWLIGYRGNVANVLLMKTKVIRSPTQFFSFKLSVMIDEMTDISNREQVTIVMRRVDDNLSIFEEFLVFVSC